MSWPRPHFCCLTWLCSGERGEQRCPPVLLWMSSGSQYSTALYLATVQPRRGFAVAWGHPPILARADKVASQCAQFGSKLFKAAAVWWRIWLCWPGPVVVLGFCAFFHVHTALAVSWGWSVLAGGWRGEEGSPVGLPKWASLTCTDSQGSVLDVWQGACCHLGER